MMGGDGNNVLQVTVHNNKTTKVTRVPLSEVENLAVGAAGGALETCLQMPILTYKFCLQEGRALPTSVPGWYRGLGVQAGTVAPITAIQFCVNGMLQKAMCSWIVGLIGSVVRLVAGASSYGRSAGAGHLNIAVYTAGYLGLAPVLSARLVSSSPTLADQPFMAGVLGACLAGTTAAVLTHPVDTAKTCMQSDMNGTVWATARSAMPKLVAEGGIQALFKGMVPRTFRLCGAFLVCMSLQDMAIGYKSNKAAAAAAASI
ncbi:Mitochondrial carrier protein [Seminavis robusta]|uniref:Mitochondrial carrier protein n=1 Tax=Seminavis robusta TaxID=568900 RepID=A0A9N8DL05_9STRA|nr:Mitochondrial carrier protein [Seminavis robusta]|eukprot:Sro200_g084690.1 Mitochondrial carrier protein (259) ;mRNA; r:38182-39321